MFHGCFGKMVRLAGLEPARVTPLPPQSSVSANSTISANGPLNESAWAGWSKSKLGFRGPRLSEPQRLRNHGRVWHLFNARCYSNPLRLGEPRSGAGILA